MKKVLLFVPMTFFLINAVYGATLNVPSDYPNFQAAVDAANQGDTISVAPGKYVGTGNCNITIAKPLNIKSQSGAENTIVECQSNENGININFAGDDVESTGFDVSIEGVTIKNANFAIIAQDHLLYHDSRYSIAVRNCIIKNNSEGVYGYGLKRMNISGCIICENNSKGIGLDYTAVEVTDSTIQNNGSGIVGDDGGVFANRCTIMGNESDGISVDYCFVTLSNSTLAWNGGDGLWNAQGPAIIVNSTIFGNRLGLNVYDSFIDFTNSILWNNGAHEVEVSGSSSIRIMNSDIIGGITGIVGDELVVDLGGNIDFDPQFVDPDGPDDKPATYDDDFHLRETSKCIDKGTTIVPDYWDPLWFETEFDFDGDPRFVGLAPDIGADEVKIEYYFFKDSDSDGYGVSSESIKASIQPTGYAGMAGDCDDNDAAIHPGANEACNGIDDNCDGTVDEGVTNTYYQDADGDNFGSPLISVAECTPPAGFVNENTDCNDNDISVFPGASEIDNNVDDNCDGRIDEGLPDGSNQPSDGGGGGGGCFIQTCVGLFPPDGVLLPVGAYGNFYTW